MEGGVRQDVMEVKETSGGDEEKERGREGGGGGGRYVLPGSMARQRGDVADVSRGSGLDGARMGRALAPPTGMQPHVHVRVPRTMKQRCGLTRRSSTLPPPALRWITPSQSAPPPPIYRGSPRSEPSSAQAPTRVPQTGRGG